MKKENPHLLFLNYPLLDKGLSTHDEVYKSASPNLAFGYLGTIADRLGCKVTIIDANFYLRPYDTNQLIDQILQLQPDFIGCSVFMDNALWGYEFLKILKEKYCDCLYVAGGPHPSILPEEPLRYGFDISCRKESERTIEDLIDYLRGNTELKKIQSISYFDENRNIIHNPDREIENNLDYIPMINYDLFDKLYFSQENIERTKFQVFASRGCPNKCTYCNSYGVFGTRFRTRSVENILEELELIYKKYGIKKINFVDDYFVLNNKRAIEICEGMIKRKINLSWGCYSKAGAISSELFEIMKKAGCDHIGYGVENVYPKTLELINKKTPLEKINAAYECTDPTGIHYKTNIMAGFPWETVESVRVNIDFILAKKRKYKALFNPVVLYPVPKTKLYEDYVDEFPIIKDHWLNKEFMIANTDLSSEGRMELNFFNLDKKVIKEIKLLFFCCRIPPLKSLNGIGFLIFYPLNRFFYSYWGAKFLNTVFYTFKLKTVYYALKNAKTVINKLLIKTSQNNSTK